MFLIHRLFIPLVLTIGIELLVSVIIIKNINTRLFMGVIAVNMATNPLLNFIIHVISDFMPVAQTGLFVVSLEIVIILVEWRLLIGILGDRSNKTFLYSFLINFTSYIFGVIFF